MITSNDTQKEIIKKKGVEMGHSFIKTQFGTLQLSIPNWPKCHFSPNTIDKAQASLNLKPQKRFKLKKEKKKKKK